MSTGNSFGLFLTCVGVSVISQDPETGDLKMSYKKVLYSLLLAVLISNGLYFQISTYFQLRDGGSLFHGLLYLYPMVADSAMSVLIILSGLYSNYVFLRFVQSPGNYNILVTILNEFSFKPIYRNLMITGLIFVGPYFSDIFYYHSSIQSRTVLYQGLSYIFVLYNFVFLNQFSITLGIIRKIYQMINDELVGMCEKLVENVDMLYRIRNKHHEMVKFCRTVNWMFALTNMGLFIHHGMLGVIYSYWGLRQIIAKHGGNDVGEMINTFRSAGLSFLSIGWLVASTVKLSVEFDRTKHLIQNPLINARSKDFLSEIQTFSLQLAMSDVAFSPYGFFKFSNELLLSMLSGIVSYLIILLQYQVMLDEQT